MGSAKTFSIQDARYSNTVSEHWIDRIAERAAHKFLSQICVGKLSIHDQDKTFEYGDIDAAEEQHAVVHVHHISFYRRLLLNGSIGAGEAYMSGSWSSPDLVSVIRLMAANMAALDSMDRQKNPFRRILSAIYQKAVDNSLHGSKDNIAAHYDLSNDLFSLFLDSKMMYSAAIFATPEMDLEAAAEYKLKHICERLDLSESDHLLEIGTGWGGLAIYAARHYGCRVTTTTLSEQQYQYAKEWVEREQLQDRVTLLLKDYRELEGQYDKLVSVEMIEAVGHKYYKEFFSRCDRLLKDDGLMLIQAITIADQRYQQATQATDFIQRYIFPGGSLPSTSVISNHLCRDTSMQLIGLEDITLDYAETLKHWRSRFFARIEEVRSAGFDDIFVRMWDFYLCYCEGGFRERAISTGQYLIAKPQSRSLPQIQ